MQCPVLMSAGHSFLDDLSTFNDYASPHLHTFASKLMV